MIQSPESHPPLGIFDSGLGGLTVLRQIQRCLPAESILYLADTANVPYGDKPLSVVRDLALKLTDHLVSKGAKLILMASGTSTVAGLAAAQRCHPSLPILGTIDAGARAAVARPGPIGVLATNATVKTRAFTKAARTLSPGREVVEVGCPRFVPLVESGRACTPEAEDAAREYLAPLAEAGVESIILGCTHFPFLLAALESALESYRAGGFQPAFIDPAEQAVREAAALLGGAGMLAPRDTGITPLVQFAATGDPQEFARHASALLGGCVPTVARLTL